MLKPEDCPKLFDLEDAVLHRQGLRQAGQRLVITNGCFDLLHPGHIHYLQHSRSLGDQLWVLINSDASVSALKGPHRPILQAAHRAFALGALACVDGVIVFNGERIIDEVIALQPDVYTKAGDYTYETLHSGERAALDAAGADIVFLPFWDGFSTTRMIERIKAAE
jgi:rfaE bifunctional protein nucleotidyltransferase chain/domain